MFSEIVNRYFQHSGSLPVCVQEDEGVKVPELARAVVILHATWSAPSGACLKCLASIRVIYPGRWLYVVDIDSVSPGWVESYFGTVSHGRGETFWIRDGHVIRREESYALRCQDIAQMTDLLFA